MLRYWCALRLTTTGCLRGVISRAQTQMGRSFGGDAFLASPTVIEFKDYEMGRCTTISVQIINRSYKKNTFRCVGCTRRVCDVYCSCPFSCTCRRWQRPGGTCAAPAAHSPPSGAPVFIVAPWFFARLQTPVAPAANDPPSVGPITALARRTGIRKSTLIESWGFHTT